VFALYFQLLENHRPAKRIASVVSCPCSVPAIPTTTHVQISGFKAYRSLVITFFSCVPFRHVPREPVSIGLIYLVLPKFLLFRTYSALRKGRGVPEGLSKIIAAPSPPSNTLLSCFAKVHLCSLICLYTCVFHSSLMYYYSTNERFHLHIVERSGCARRACK
jgi:hypothetical protein